MPGSARSPRYVDDEDYRGGFSAEDIDELLESLEPNYLGWSAAMALVIVGNAERPELGEELTNSFCEPVAALADWALDEAWIREASRFRAAPCRTKVPGTPPPSAPSWPPAPRRLRPSCGRGAGGSGRVRAGRPRPRRSR
ncbi:hypothetical protein AMK16_26415 [Streptomyces sp. CB00455]|nr:hypothetical protein AMK16_26415 [Streptomyces sp. CB00455]